MQACAAGNLENYQHVSVQQVKILQTILFMTPSVIEQSNGMTDLSNLLKGKFDLHAIFGSWIQLPAGNKCL